MAFVPTNQSETRQWLLKFQEANDSLDVSRLPSIYAKDIKLQFANNPVLQGLEAVTEHYRMAWAALDFMHHEIGDVDLVGGDKIYQACSISFRVKNDPEMETVQIPGMAVLHLTTSEEEKGLVKRAEYYLDTSPLGPAFSRIGT
ncbi:hypothetical protein BX600DRAFT_465530 [Xylariales sp. PMI_506]|nr:hypothetical protein BX600DRAFT_465530 [Xylariales sp. PMI_506]